jgi:hypothetical protein
MGGIILGAGGEHLMKHSTEIAWAKLSAMAEGAHLASVRLWR